MNHFHLCFPVLSRAFEAVMLFHVFHIYDLQKGPWWFLIHSGGFPTSSASWFHVELQQMPFITQKSVFLFGAWWFPAWLFAVKNIFTFQFPPQSIRNMSLTLLETIYDINIVEMQTQGWFWSWITGHAPWWRAVQLFRQIYNAATSWDTFCSGARRKLPPSKRISHDARLLAGCRKQALIAHHSRPSELLRSQIKVGNRQFARMFPEQANSCVWLWPALTRTASD